MPTTYAVPDGRVAMAATLYTGNGTSQSINNAVNGVSFQPDFVWVKNRTQSYNHILQDSVRGTGVYLSSSTTDADQATSTAVTAFNSNGFSIGSISGGNYNGNAIVGWQWKAGGTSSSNTNGSITSTVSVNATAGFSVVTYTGTGSSATVGHGLGVAPSMVIIKNRTLGTENWAVYHVSTGAAYWLLLSGTNAAINNTTIWNNTTPTSSTISLGAISNTNVSGSNFVAYCWAEVAGYSKFGSYTGNGSSDGPFIFCNFRPRFILYKNANYAGTSWAILDTARNSYNVENARLFADSSGVEDTSVSPLDGLSNGFKVRSTNDGVNRNGDTIIYAAFAENPFKYANAR